VYRTAPREAYAKVYLCHAILVRVQDRDRQTPLTRLALRCRCSSKRCLVNYIIILTS